MKKVIIAIDGHSSSGKSTLAKSLAKELNILYIDSGAMYRAVTCFCMQHDLIADGKVDVSSLTEKLDQVQIEFRRNDATGNFDTFLNHENVEKAIRSMEVSSRVSEVSKIKEVREKLVRMQRSYAENTSVVMDGRDIGSVVFPDADLKIFVTASAGTRAKRRYKELIEKGYNVNYDEILQNVLQRDTIDQTREVSPLIKADDAIELDTGNLSIREQLDWALEKVQQLLTNN